MKAILFLPQLLLFTTGFLAAQNDDVGPLQSLKAPVKLELAKKIVGEGEKRKSGVRITNTSGKNMKSFVVSVYYLDAGGEEQKSVPFTRSGFSGVNSVILARGKQHVMEVDSFFMEDDTASIDAILTEIEYSDGTSWPEVPETPAVRKDDEPVAAKMVGVLGKGVTRQPVIACYNFEDKEVVLVNFQIKYFDANGEELKSTGYGYFGDGAIKENGSACFAGGDPPPAGTVGVKVSLNQVRFADETEWKPSKD
ncbi:MAG: hypothetical protein AAF585_13850 [Verrucomicrobiota bacterium]